MSNSVDSNDSAVYQLNANDDPPSGYLLHKVVSTLLSHFNIMDTGAASYESRDKIPPVMKEGDSTQNWRPWKAIYPPAAQNYSQKVLQATLDVAKKILLFPEYAIKDVINELQISLSPKMIAVDWTLYLYLLEHDKGILTRDLFGSNDEYEACKKDELAIVKGLLNGGNIDQSHDDYNESKVTEGYSIAQLSLTRTRNLHRKALMSDVYSVIHFQDLYTVSPVTNSVDQCPMLKHKLSFLLRDAGCSDETPVIVISLWYKKPGLRSDGFLGYIKLSVQELLENSDGKERGFDLHKRSNRSNISGKLFLKIKRIHANTLIKDLYADIMTCIPFCYNACLRDLLEVLYSRKIGADINAQINSKGDYKYRAIIDTIAIAWNAPIYTTSLISCDILYKLYVQNKVPLKLLKEEAVDQCLPYVKSETRKIPTKVRNALHNFFEKLYTHLKERLITVLDTEIDEKACKEYGEIIELLSILQEHINVGEKDIKTVAEESIFNFMNYLKLLSFSENMTSQEKQTGSQCASKVFTYDKIRAYIDRIKSFLSSCLFQLNDICKDYNINIPEITALTAVEKINEVLQQYKHISCENVDATFRAYNSLMEFNGICKVANRDASERINVREFFFEGVTEWLDNKEIAMRKFILNAVDVDDFQIVSPQAYYTSSLVDIFCCFSLNLNFIKNLNWSNADDVALFNQRLYGTMLRSLSTYTDIMIDRINNELECMSGKINSPEREQQSTTNGSKFEKQVKANGKGTQNNNFANKNNELKISSLICAQLADIMAIKQKTDNLLGVEKSLIVYNSKVENLGPKVSGMTIPDTLTLRSQRLIKNSFVPIKITLDTLEVATSKDMCLSPICVELSYNDEIIITTKPLVHSMLKPVELNEHSWVNLTEGIESMATSLNSNKDNKSICSKIEVRLHKLTYENNFAVKSEKVISSAVIEIDWLSAGEYNQSVVLPGYGKINFKILSLPFEQRMHMFPSIVAWLVEYNTKKALQLIANSIAFSYRSQLKTISYKFKSISKDYINKMFNSIDVLEKSRKSITNSIVSLIPQQQIDQEIVSKELGPVLSFLNDNLEIIVNEFPLTPAINLISEIWDNILLANESLIVPLDIGSKKEKAAWSEERIKFLSITTQILYIFFECDGEGLSSTELHTHRYLHLNNLMKNYYKPRRDLYEKLNHTINNFKITQRKEIIANGKCLINGHSVSNDYGTSSPEVNMNSPIAFNNKNILDTKYKQYLPAYYIFQILKVHGDNEGIQNYIKELNRSLSTPEIDSECNDNNLIPQKIVHEDISTRALSPLKG